MQYFLLVFCKEIVDYISTSSKLTDDFLEEAQLAPTVTEEVDFRLRLDGGSSSLLLSLGTGVDRFPPLLVVGVKNFVIFDMMKPRKMATNFFRLVNSYTCTVLNDKVVSTL